MNTNEEYNDLEFYNKFTLPLNESIDDYSITELLDIFLEDEQIHLLSLPELPIAYMMETYKEYKNKIKYLKD